MGKGRNVNPTPGRPGEPTGFSQLLSGHRAWAGDKSRMCGATDVKNTFPERSRQVDVSTDLVLEEGGRATTRPGLTRAATAGEGRALLPG